jgi:glutamate-1-semialdehyde 2,1-aminomutase
MFGLLFSEKAPANYREWVTSDYSFYNSLAPRLHERGVLCEPDSREPWFISAAHDDECLARTLEAFEGAVDETIRSLRRGRGRVRNEAVPPKPARTKRDGGESTPPPAPTA